MTTCILPVYRHHYRGSKIHTRHSHAQISSNKYVSHGARVSGVEIPVRSSFRRMAGRYWCDISPHLTPALQHWPQNRTIRKHLQRNVAECAACWHGNYARTKKREVVPWQLRQLRFHEIKETEQSPCRRLCWWLTAVRGAGTGGASA